MGIAPIVDSVAVRTPIDLASAIFFAVTFAAVLVVTLRRPAAGVAMLVAAIPFDLSRDVGPTTITLAKTVLAGLGAGLLFRRPSFRVLRTRGALVAGAGAFAILVATAISIHAADYRGPAVRETLKAAQYLAIYAGAAVATADDADGPLLDRAVTWTTLAVALLAIAQIVTGAPSGVWYSGHAIPRIAGPLEGPNQLSGYLGIALPCILAFALSPRLGARERFATLASLGIGSAALFLTLSRAGVIASLAALGAVAALSHSGAAPLRRAALTAIGAGFAAGFAVVGGVVFMLTHSFTIVHAVIGHFGTATEVENAGSVGNRTILWHAAIALWREHPIFGVGAGNFELEVGRAGPAGVRTHANSLYLQSLAEGGLVLFAATIGSMAATLAVLIRSLRSKAGEPLVLGLACALAGFAVHQIFDLLVFFPKIGDLVWTLTGVAVARIATIPPSGGDVLPPHALPDTKLPPRSRESSSTR